MKSWKECLLVVVVIWLISWLPTFVFCSAYAPDYMGPKILGPCHCWKCLLNPKAEAKVSYGLDGWEQGEFITYRKTYAHSCGGTLTFNGKSERAPYSENDVFYTHVCDKCNVTNQMLNAHWPQFKREWRDAK